MNAYDQAHPIFHAQRAGAEPEYALLAAVLIVAIEDAREIRANHGEQHMLDARRFLVESSAGLLAIIAPEHIDVEELAARLLDAQPWYHRLHLDERPRRSA